MHALLFPIGSYGDVHPYVGLGLALRERGHRVTVFSCPYFAELFERTGLDFEPFGTVEQYETTTADPRLWHPRKSFEAVWKGGVEPNFEKQFETIRERYEPGETVVLSSCLGVGARIAQEALGVPLVTVQLQPVVFWSDFESPRFAGTIDGPRWLRRFQFWIGERFVIDPIVRPSVNAFRAEHGLPPMNRTVRWWHSTDCNLCLFPEWFGPRQPDWPATVEYAGFPLWDESVIEEPDDEVRAFLDSGDPPIVFTPGSANRQAASFFRAAVEACSHLGRRGLLLTKFPEQVPKDLPPDVRHFHYVPFAHVLDRAAAVVHHGGVGTTAQCLRAGVPQLVVPMAHDQPDNAIRLKRLGVADSITPAAFKAPRAVERLQRLLGSDNVRRACVDVRNRMLTAENPLDRACEIVERVSAERQPDGA